MDRERLQEQYISRLIDGMDWNDLAQYVYDKLDEEMDELEDATLLEHIQEYAPDLLTEE